MNRGEQMIYVKDNVERIVDNIVEARKLESCGFKPVNPVKPEVVLSADEKPETDAVTAPVQRGRKKKEA